jgi:hypothetical protein
MSEDVVTQYWQGVLDTCEYFANELGFEDAMKTDLAAEALEYLNG